MSDGSQGSISASSISEAGPLRTLVQHGPLPASPSPLPSHSRPLPAPSPHPMSTHLPVSGKVSGGREIPSILVPSAWHLPFAVLVTFIIAWPSVCPPRPDTPPGSWLWSLVPGTDASTGRYSMGGCRRHGQDTPNPSPTPGSELRPRRDALDLLWYLRHTLKQLQISIA